jgi:ABC-type transporter Mla subunit MlaD
MRGRGPIQSLASSPTMIGAVTTLIVVVAVFLAYNAHRGLPFVSVYRVAIDVPNAARLVDYNEVRIGGHRVGMVESLEPVFDSAHARLHLKLDESAAPLPQDSVFRIRYRSSFGLKYLEIIRGTGEPAPEGFTFDGTNDTGECRIPEQPETFSEDIPESARDGCFQDQTEFDEINETFDAPTRRNIRRNLVGYGDGFTGRGMSLNDTIEGLEPLFRHLRPVGAILADRETRFRRFFPSLARAAEIVAPVATTQAELFTRMAITFAAISEDPAALQDTIAEGPPTLETGIETFPAQRRFMGEFAEASRELRPGVRDLATTLPTLNEAMRIGTPVLHRSPATNRRLRDSLRSLHDLVNRPVTRVMLERLAETFDMARPLARYVVPAQTVCNYWSYWFTHLPAGFDQTQVGMSFRQILASYPSGPPAEGLPGQAEAPVGGYSGISANGRTAGSPTPAQAGRPQATAAASNPGTFMPWDLPISNSKPYMVTGQDGDDCQGGQWGYMLGRVPVPGQPAHLPAVARSDLPGSRGPTMLFWNRRKQRELHDTRIPSRQPRTWRAFGDLRFGGGR